MMMGGLDRSCTFMPHGSCCEFVVLVQEKCVLLNWLGTKVLCARVCGMPVIFG